MRNLKSLLLITPAVLFSTAVLASPLNNPEPGKARRQTPVAASTQGLTAPSKAPNVGERTEAAHNPLVAQVSTQLGVSREKAGKGLGLLFRLSQQQLTQPQFQALGMAVPGMSSMLSSGKSSMQNQSTKVLNAKTAPRLDPNGVHGMLTSMGYTNGQIQRMVHIVKTYLNQHTHHAGHQVAQLFQKGIQPVAQGSTAS